MKPHGRAEPRFDIDLAFGRKGETMVAEYLEWLVQGETVEVKRKRYLDWDFYVETHCDKGAAGRYVPSGISVTTAIVWAIVIADTGICLLVPTSELRAMLDDPSSRPCEEREGSCPTRGMLVNLSALLYRHKQRATKQPSWPPQSSGTQQGPCIHKPEYREPDGTCWICKNMRAI